MTTLSPVTGSKTTFSYDDNGQRTQATTGSSTKTYGYSAHGSLASFQGSATVSYQADGDNLRQSRTQGTSTKDFTWDTSAGLPLLLDDEDNSYVYGPNSTPIAQIDDATGATSYLYGDNVGSVRLIVDATGAVTRTASYSEYGAVAFHTGSGTSAIGYTGNWTDPTSGLVYLRARDYDPATGQFLSVDPALSHTHQPYSYTRNQPVNAVDLTGLCPVNGGANVADCTAADFGANPFFLSPGALAIGDTLNSPVGRAASSVLEGVGDAASFGLTVQLRQALGADCYVERNAFYYGGFAVGVAASTAAYGLGISAAAARIGNTTKLLNYATETASDATKAASEAVQALKGPIADAIPRSLPQQMALDTARQGYGVRIMGTMNDAPRLVANYGQGEWVKMQYVLRGNDSSVTVHYFRNIDTGVDVEFKFP